MENVSTKMQRAVNIVIILLIKGREYTARKIFSFIFTILAEDATTQNFLKKAFPIEVKHYLKLLELFV